MTSQSTGGFAGGSRRSPHFSGGVGSRFIAFVRARLLSRAKQPRAEQGRRGCEDGADGEGDMVPAVERGERICSEREQPVDRKSTRLNSSHGSISYAVFCLKKKKNEVKRHTQKQIT